MKECVGNGTLFFFRTKRFFRNFAAQFDDKENCILVRKRIFVFPSV